MTDKAPDGVAVTKADREAAITCLFIGLQNDMLRRISAGEFDEHQLVQAFARHRLDHSTPDTPSAGYLHADNPCVNEPALCDRCNGGPCDSLPPATGNNAGEPVALAQYHEASGDRELEWFRHGSGHLTDADKEAGWTEVLLYAHPPAPTNLGQDREEVIVKAAGRAIHEYCCKRDVMTYLANKEDCLGLARAAYAAALPLLGKS